MYGLRLGMDAVNEDLKPCPWCGEVPTIGHLPNEPSSVACQTRACPVRPETDWYDDDKEAADAWNKRQGEQSK